MSGMGAEGAELDPSPSAQGHPGAQGRPGSVLLSLGRPGASTGRPRKGWEGGREGGRREWIRTPVLVPSTILVPTPRSRGPFGHQPRGLLVLVP